MDGHISEVPTSSLRASAGLMQDLRLESLFPMDELSPDGIAETSAEIPPSETPHSTDRRCSHCRQSDVLITIDSPDFCLRVARWSRWTCAACTTLRPRFSITAPGKRAAKKWRLYRSRACVLFPSSEPISAMQAAGWWRDFTSGGRPAVTTEMDALV
jgi:lipid-A-disaccharide synthase